ncbi:MAG: ATP-binding cassette domain-containing protein [Desulfomonile tiedjei]|nr:ATP-binding cassette domain-containing protein [Desulfomonile tiedjei]
MTSSRPSTTTEKDLKEAADSEVILKVEGVSKKFSYSLKDVLKYGTRRLFREFFGLPSQTDRLEAGEFWALDDLSFELKRGETLGIIGRNGAGKSTLLKIVNGIFLPDRGRVAIKGTVAGLIEIGAGFQPNLTGRENIYIIASILGMTKEQVDRIFDQIVAFADIGKFIDSPVQSYSSGMIVRLGFAIHVFQKPDVLLADEILAVGDFEFQQKCLEKISEIKNEVGLILVSHSMPTVTRFCDRVIVLNRGKILFDGPPQQAMVRMVESRYEPGIRNQPTNSRGDLSFPEDPGFLALFDGGRVPKSLFGPEYHDAQRISHIRCDWIADRIDGFTSVGMFDDLCLRLSFRLHTPTKRLAIGVPFWSTDGTLLTACNSDSSGHRIIVDGEGLITCRLTIQRISLIPGQYVPCLAIHDGPGYIYRKVLDPLVVTPRPLQDGGPSLHFGVYAETCTWQFSQDSVIEE